VSGDGVGRTLARDEVVDGTGRIPALDGVRGIAILTVLLGHLTDYGGMQPAVLADRLYHRVALLGGLGVDLFFVLSGFLITGILLAAKGQPDYFRNFYARRLLRIFPVYYGFLILVFVVAPALGGAGPALQATLPDQVWYWSYLANFRIAFHGWPEFGGVGHFWSLAVEEQFYFVWPLIVAFTPRRTFIALCGVLIACGPLVRVTMWLGGLPPMANVLTIARADALALGALLAVLVRAPGGVQRLTLWLRPIAAAAAVALAVMLIWAGGWNTSLPVIPIGGRSLTIIASAGLIAVAIGAHPAGWVHRVLTSRLLVFYGAISYGLYVVHPPLLLWLRNSGLSVNVLPRWGGSQLPGQLVVIAVGTLISTAIAYLSFRYFELPFIRLKARFTSPPPAPSAVQPAKPVGVVSRLVS
jgi:peptidoglycan/LPS O-acetylase OafA/YrhL